MTASIATAGPGVDARHGKLTSAANRLAGRLPGRPGHPAYRCAGFPESRIPNPESHAHQHGYTLIEVIVAFAILALGLTLLLGTLTGATRQVHWADEAGRAALHAQSLLDDTGVGVALQPGQTSGTFEDGHYHWSMVVSPYRDPLLPPMQSLDLGAPRLLRLSLTVQWGEDSGTGDNRRRRLQVQSLRLVTPNPLATGALATGNAP